MYKYTVEAFDESDMGKLNIIHIVVQAADEEQAMARAAQIKQRTNYAVVGIEELTGDNRPELKKKG
jgi:hypothetical protein